MKVSIDWLKELVEVESVEKLIELLPLRTIGTKEVTSDFIELDMKGYNRADTLSMRGVAYEVAAILSSRVKFEEENRHIEETGTNLQASVENEQDCKVYMAARIEGVTLGKSSDLEAKRLMDAGVRSVNNVVDVTNLVMLEYGQPLHAFDGASCGGDASSIEVRRAREGEKIQTLDGEERELDSRDIVISSKDQVIGIAGIMGGKDSEVTDQTKVIILEAAIFDPKVLRQTANRLGLHSEAAKRFYHGLTKRRLVQAFEQAIEEFKKLGGTVTDVKVVGGMVDEVVDINLNPSKINGLIGVDLETSAMIDSLTKLHFEVSDDQSQVRVPYWRLDCRLEVDLIEEIARMYGYEKIPAKELVGERPAKIDQSKFEKEQKIRESLIDAGFNEVLSYSFASSKVRIGLDWSDDELVRVANPLSSETEYMRFLVWPNLVEKVIENLKYRKEVRMFEIGKRYQVIDGQVVEENVISIAVADGTDNPLEDLWGRLQVAAKQNGVEWKVGQELGDKSLHPNRQFEVMEDGDVTGMAGEVNRQLVDGLGGTSRVAVAEMVIG